MSSKELVCPQCFLQLASLEEYIKHCDEIHFEVFFLCPKCTSQEKRYRKTSLLAHVRVTHATVFECQVCFKMEYVSHYRRHQHQHIASNEVAFCPW